jgi:hypothetical protein
MPAIFTTREGTGHSYEISLTSQQQFHLWKSDMIFLLIREVQGRVPEVGPDLACAAIDHMCIFKSKSNKQESHDGPEITHLYIGPRGRVNFDPKACHLNKLGRHSLKMFHAKYLSSSFLDFFKECFFEDFPIHI